MMLVVILVSILSGFCAGYATRALGVRERVERDPLNRPYGPVAFRRSNPLVKVRRAF